jgi:hypothetical protein
MFLLGLRRSASDRPSQPPHLVETIFDIGHSISALSSWHPDILEIVHCFPVALEYSKLGTIHCEHGSREHNHKEYESATFEQALRLLETLTRIKMPSFQRVLRRSVIDHWYPALMVALVVTILHHDHWLDWLDVAVSRVTSVAATSGSDVSNLGDDTRFLNRDLKSVPLILVINASMFENDFRQTSPLDRGKLAEWIEKIANERPRLVVIDLDLSPGPRDQIGSISGSNGALSADYTQLSNAAQT